MPVTFKNKIKLSKEFKTQTAKSVAALLFFGIVYIIIILMAILLTLLCAYGGIMLIINIHAFVIILLGIGLASMGFLILIFLFKFIFKSHKTDRSHLQEITKEQEPELFALIRDIVKQVGTGFPKKVYLSGEVNAAVFYDSSFWSMFFPIRKNLVIGIGLVNSVTTEELKAILSHEFGHFSQRSMKVGSYVYNVNQIIFNMLFDNASYDDLIKDWASISNYFAIFVKVALEIIHGIQWLLRKLYEVVNISYQGLSREMEFHADEIAANITGHAPLKSSLLRLSLSECSYNAVLDFYGDKISDNLKSANIYKEQEFVTNFQAKEASIPLQNSFPNVTTNSLRKYNKSRLVIKDQWASHPSNEERIQRLESLGIPDITGDPSPANNLFRNIETYQTTFTDKLFSQIQYNGEIIVNELTSFASAYETDRVKNSFDKIYNGYYDNKIPASFDVNSIGDATDDIQLSDLFSQEKVDHVYTSLSIQSDIDTLKQINSNDYNIKSFEYDGKKYKKKDIDNLISQLQTEADKAQEILKLNDIRIYQFFRKQEKLKSREPKLQEYYNDFFNFDKEFDKKIAFYNELHAATQFVNVSTPFAQIEANLKKVKDLETKLKEAIAELVSNELYKSEVSKEMKANFDSYLSQDWLYFFDNAYFNDNLKVLFTAMNNYYFLISRGYFLYKKKLLHYQAELV